jgi:DNA-binding winged helix-turn-helix (wHTH) protein/Tol biopolymer transport system component
MQASILYFDQFELDLNSYELRKSGHVIKLEKLPMELLILLAEKRGQLVTRQQIIQRLWGDDVFVDTRQGINTAIRKVRMALRDDPEHPHLLQTIAGRGYRLLAPVSTRDENTQKQPAPQLPLPPSFPPSMAPASTVPAVRWRYVLVVAIVLVALVSVIFWLSLRGSSHPATEQRVTFNPPDAPITFAVVSPDGRYVAYADPTGLYWRQLSSGETRPWGVPQDFIAHPNSWFPDSTHLLVTRFDGASRIPSLWKLSLLGGRQQMLMDNAAAGAVSPDGSRIAYLPGPDVGSEVWLMDSDGANRRKIAAAETADRPLRGRIWPVVWSPRGRRIAYIESHGLAVLQPEEDSFSLQTRDANGGDLQVVLSDTRLKQALCWVADGRILYAYRDDPSSERSDEGVYSIRVDERTGKAISQPQTITSSQGRVGGLSVTSDGKQLVLWRENTQPQAFIAEFEAGSPRLKTSRRRLTMDANGNIAEAWTSDSKAVLFVSNRNGTWGLFKQNIDETTAEVLVEGRSIFLPRLSPDGSHVLYLTSSKSDDSSLSASLMSKSLAGGPPRLVLQEKGVIRNYQCARAPSQLCIFSKLVGANHIFVSFDLEHGTGRELTRITNFAYANWTLSPDGRKVAIFLNRHQIRFLSLDTGVAHDVSIDYWPLQNGDWSADGKSVFVPSVTSKDMRVILDVNEAGKAEVVLEGDANTMFWWFLESPDGRYGMLEATVPGDNNAWMVKNF